MNIQLKNSNNKVMANHPYWFVLLLFILLAGLIQGCSTRQVQEGVTVSREASWVLLPMLNLAEVPQAAERAEAVLETFLHSKGIHNLTIYPHPTDGDALLLLDERSRYNKAMAWAREKDFDYAITGSVEEWRYKSGLDGEPAVGLSLRIIDMKTGRVIWSASGARTGWGYDSTSGVAISLVSKLLDGIDIE